MSHMRLQKREIDKSALAIDYSTSHDLGMRIWPDRLPHRAALGPRAANQICLQRVRGLDRVLRGRVDG